MGKFRSAATSDQAAAQPEGSRRSRGSRKLRNRIRHSWQGRDRGPGRKSAAYACFGPAASLALKLGTAQDPSRIIRWLSYGWLRRPSEKTNRKFRKPPIQLVVLPATRLSRNSPRSTLLDRN